MKVLYIGQYSDGTTSKMRADEINTILQSSLFDVIDIHIPFFETGKLSRSIGFRYKIGPLIKNTNTYVLEELQKKSSFYDLIWVDKAVFLTANTLEEIRKKTGKLLHFTPDMAFYKNRSPLFEKGMHLFDHLITTKSAEVDIYKKYISPKKLIVTTQGFSKEKHKPTKTFEKKENAVAFVGLAEKNRFEMAEFLLSQNIHLKIAGMGWKKFSKSNAKNPYFHFYGEGIYGKEYASFISSSFFGLGLLSKKFPEYHTTRTFEIPACGTALLTERNKETCSFFEEDEVLFYSTTKELIEKLKYFTSHQEELKELTEKGKLRVNKDGYDYGSILMDILNKVQP